MAYQVAIQRIDSDIHYSFTTEQFYNKIQKDLKIDYNPRKLNILVIVHGYKHGHKFKDLVRSQTFHEEMLKKGYRLTRASKYEKIDNSQELNPGKTAFEVQNLAYDRKYDQISKNAKNAQYKIIDKQQKQIIDLETKIAIYQEKYFQLDADKTAKIRELEQIITKLHAKAADQVRQNKARYEQLQSEKDQWQARCLQLLDQHVQIGNLEEIRLDLEELKRNLAELKTRDLINEKIGSKVQENPPVIIQGNRQTKIHEKYPAKGCDQPAAADLLSPRMWGCTKAKYVNITLNIIVPTHVGVYRTIIPSLPSRLHCPHACGGVPG